MGLERAGLTRVATAAAATAFALWFTPMLLVGSPQRYVAADYPISGTTTTSSTTSTTIKAGTLGSGSTGASGGESAGLVFTSGPPSNTGSALAFTGANVELTMAVGAGAVGVGGVIVLAAKRRRRPVRP